MKSILAIRSVLAALAAMTLVSAQGWAQAAPAPSRVETSTTTTTKVVTTTENPEEVIQMSPFMVSADEDKGSYRATATLAGARVRTDLKDVASSLSVVTAEFMRDANITNNQDLLTYTTNTEVGGVYGNYAGVGTTFIDGASESSNFLKPSQNTRVRGLDSADNSRDYFQTDLPWDSYNVGRVDLQRGPNSILFGIGSPAGIINASINTATYKNGGDVEARVGSFGAVRYSLDYNLVLVPDQLAIRVSALDDNNKYHEQPAFNHDRRLFGALRWDPDLFHSKSAKTTLRMNYEYGDVKANRPRVLPPKDQITPFFDPNAINKQTWDPYYAWASGIIPYSSTTTPPEVTKNYWLVQYMGAMRQVDNPMFSYGTVNAQIPSSTKEAWISTYWGISATGQRDGGIDGFPYGSDIGIASYGQMTFDTWRNLGDAGGFPAADKGFYKSKTLSDPTIFNFYNQLIDGPNKKEWNHWNAYNITFDQTFLDNRLGFEVVYDRQLYNDGQERNLNDAYISVDVRQFLPTYPSQYATAVTNPNAGAVFTGSSSKNSGNSSTISDRENFRVTAFGEIRASDFMDKSLLTRILGHHLITGLISREDYQQEARSWARYAVDASWSEKVGNGGQPGNPMSGAYVGGLTGGDITVDWITYLSGDVRGLSTASGLNLSRIKAVQSPAGTYGITYYDSHWNAPNVDPAAYWHNPARSPLPSQGNDPAGTPGIGDTQSNNPANYVGWVTDSFTVLNADRGDIDRLYTDAAKVRKRTTSTGVVWQGYLVDDTIVGTFGWRHDEQKQRAGASIGTVATGGVALTNPPLDPQSPIGISKGTSVTWGAVVHTPKFLRDKLPFGSDISLTYSDGRNTRVENRFGFDGMTLPNAKGRTKDLGVVITTLNDKLSFKATRYVTDVTDANLSSVTTEVSTLGNGTYYLKNLEAEGTASAMYDLAGREGVAAGLEWYWNWAYVAGEPGTAAHQWDANYWDPTPTGTAESRARFYAHPDTIKQDAAITSWLNQMMPQAWYDAYGFPVNVAAAEARDWRHFSPGWTPAAYVTLAPANGGRINGAWPTGTANNESKGWEFEIAGTPIKGLNVSINASKQFATQTALGASLVNFIEAQHAKYMSPAGDLRLWWGGDQNFRTYYNQQIWSAYQFQLASAGRMVPEMSPWRANAIANYAFQGEGLLKGINVGVGYRWQQGHVVGYALNTAQDNLDLDRPYWTNSEDAVDMWVGYDHKLSSKISWRIQLNVRNLGQHSHLVAISVQPDGSPGLSRIEEGMSWSITNTLSF